jgi:hypothetical protein
MIKFSISYPFNPVPAMPLIKYFCAIKKATIDGKMDKTVAADNNVHLIPYRP